MIATIKPTEQPKWHQLRWRVSNWLVAVARKISPENPEVEAYWMEQLAEQMIYGMSVSRVGWYQEGILCGNHQAKPDNSEEHGP